METEHLIFTYKLQSNPNHKTVIQFVDSKFDMSNLGMIKWDNGWRCYIFIPTIKYETKWSYDCQLELAKRINQLNITHKVDLKIKQLRSCANDGNI